MLIVDNDQVLITLPVLISGDSDLLPTLHLDRVGLLFEAEGTNQRSFQIDHDRYVFSFFGSRGSYILDDLVLFKNVEVVHIDTRYIQTLLNHFRDCLFVIRLMTYRADDLGGPDCYI